MEFNISDEQILEMAQKQMKLVIKDKIYNVLNDAGNVNYFREQTIQSLTYEAVRNMIVKEYIDSAIKNIDKDRLIKEMSK